MHTQALLIAFLHLFHFSISSPLDPHTSTPDNNTQWSIFFVECCSGRPTIPGGSRQEVDLFNSPLPAADSPSITPQYTAVFDITSHITKGESQGPVKLGGTTQVTWDWASDGNITETIAVGHVAGLMRVDRSEWTIVKETGRILYTDSSGLDCRALYGAGPGERGSTRLSAE